MLHSQWILQLSRRHIVQQLYMIVQLTTIRELIFVPSWMVQQLASLIQQQATTPSLQAML